MSKAEEAAYKAYPEDIEEFVDVNGVRSVVDNNSWQRTIFLKGYRQAEKDAELTWEDINTIIGLYNDLDDKILCNPKRGCKDILKQFKEKKYGDNRQNKGHNLQD